MSQIQTEIRGAAMEVIARHFHAKMQGVYSALQDELGGLPGDCDPFTTDALERAEQALADIAAPWLFSLLPFDTVEALGADGTLRS